jgi:hypothetical protein
MICRSSELATIEDPIEVLVLLRTGDRLAHCHGLGWRLVRADIAVSELAVGVLKRGGVWFVVMDGVNVPYDFGGGRLAPLGDALIGQDAQTWAWAEGASRLVQ